MHQAFRKKRLPQLTACPNVPFDTLQRDNVSLATMTKDTKNVGREVFGYLISKMYQNLKYVA